MSAWLAGWWPVCLLLTVVLGLGVVASVHAEREQARCTSAGGQWVRVNCHQVEDQNCITTDYGNGMMITSCMPMTSTACDVVCRGATMAATVTR